MTNSNDKLYFIWRDARQECYHNGASMCEEWWNDFTKFKDWALSVGYEYDNEQFFFFLQRKDKNVQYEPDNCFFRIKGRRKNEQIKKEESEVLSDEQKKEICNAYKTTVISTRELARRYNVCQRTIMNVLRKNGINSKNREIKIIDLPGEIWKEIPGFNGNYSVSNKGRIKSKNYKGMCESLMFLKVDDAGYLITSLSLNGERFAKKVHRLVAEAFVPNPNPKLFNIVNHKNEIRSDARAENLEWCTQEYNVKYSSGQKVVAINPITKEQKEFLSIQSVKNEGFDPSLVVKCCKGIRSSHKGFIWKYKN